MGQFLNYLVANTVQALPLSIGGLILVYAFRKKFLGYPEDIICGVVGGITLHLCGRMNPDSQNFPNDVAIFSGLWGALYGLVCFKLISIELLQIKDRSQHCCYG